MLRMIHARFTSDLRLLCRGCSFLW